MISDQSQSMDVNALDTTLALGASAHSDAGRSTLSRAETLQRNGNWLIIAGFVITIVGVVLYCTVSFAADMSADLADVLFRNTVPFARTTLGVLGFGTLVWLVGSFMCLRGAVEAEFEQEVDEPEKR